MAREQFANNAISYLSSAIDAVVTTFDVADASQFPGEGDFVILIDQELIQVTGVAGSTFTCVRGYEGTGAATHNNGAVVALIVTAGSLLRYLRNDVSLFSESAIPLSNHLVDDSGNVLTASDFTPINQGDSTLSDYASGGVYLSVPKLIVLDLYARVYKKSAPSPPYTLTVQMSHWMLYQIPPTQAGYAGIGFRESGTGKLMLFSMTGLGSMIVEEWDSPIYVTGSPPVTAEQEIWASSPVWLQIEDEGGAGDLIFRYGIDGIHWNELHSVDRDTFMTGGPNEILLSGVTWASSGGGGVQATQTVTYSTWIEE